jgi:hypothetical protein
LTGSNASSPRPIAASSTPAASAAAAAASALRALCSPSARPHGQRAGRRVDRELAALQAAGDLGVDLPLRVVQREIENPVAGRRDAPDARVRIVGREHGDAVRRERGSPPRVRARPPRPSP